MLNCQPLVVETLHGLISLAHNGELVNANPLKQTVSNYSTHYSTHSLLAITREETKLWLLLIGVCGFGVILFDRCHMLSMSSWSRTWMVVLDRSWSRSWIVNTNVYRRIGCFTKYVLL